MATRNPPLTQPTLLPEIDRRRFLQLTAGVAASLSLSQLPAGILKAARPPGDYPFTLGVASGDPRGDGVALWTRLAPSPLVPGGGMPNQAVEVDWEVATDEAMADVVATGTAVAPHELAHSVHVEVAGLQPWREYFYRFRAGDHVSAVGRTKTTPETGTPLDRLTFAFASCQDWQAGFYSAYRRMAEEDLDVVVHLGDYIYEYGIGPTGGARNVAVPGVLRTEAMRLAEYRVRYALYRTDPDLQEAHRLFPWLVTWDDHEVENDYAGDDPESFPAGGFLKRRAAAYQAYYEHQPLRLASLPSGPNALLYRRVTYGDLAEFSVLDTRQYRSDPPCGRGEQPRCDLALDPATTMTGTAQERWLLDGLDASGATWNVLAQQVMMGELDHRIYYEGNTVFWQDAWDGFPAARARILDHVATREIRNPVVITGDWHSTFVNDLKVDFADPASPVVATEFVGTSISSNGDAIVYGPYYGPMVPDNPHIRFFDGDRRGYVRCTVTPETWTTDLRMVSTVSRSDAPVETFASFVVEDGTPGAQQL
jgi:alkaline phosphatase D